MKVSLHLHKESNNKVEAYTIEGNHLLSRMPDWANGTIRGTEDKFGKFVWDKNFDVEGVVSRPPHILKNGSIYFGQWSLEGKLHGRGTLVARNGGKFEGFFCDDRPTGPGRIIKADGSYYIGGMKDHCVQHGKGCERQDNGATFEGDYVNGQKTGRGRLIIPCGRKYEGEFSQDTMHGLGKLTVPNGEVYEGQFQANRMHGLGVYKWADGRQYKGSYINSLKEGYGQMIWPSGASYQGEWSEGKMHGHGCFTHIDGMVKMGTFIKDKGIQVGYYTLCSNSAQETQHQVILELPSKRA